MVIELNDREEIVFQKKDYTDSDLITTLSENEINAATRETRVYVQEERENEKTDEKIRI